MVNKSMSTIEWMWTDFDHFTTLTFPHDDNARKFHTESCAARALWNNGKSLLGKNYRMWNSKFHIGRGHRVNLSILIYRNPIHKLRRCQVSPCRTCLEVARLCCIKDGWHLRLSLINVTTSSNLSIRKIIQFSPIGHEKLHNFHHLSLQTRAHFNEAGQPVEKKNEKQEERDVKSPCNNEDWWSMSKLFMQELFMKSYWKS